MEEQKQMNFSNIPTTSERKPVILESDRGKEFHNSVFQVFSRVNDIHYYSLFTDKRLFLPKSLYDRYLFVKKTCIWKRKC